MFPLTLAFAGSLPDDGADWELRKESDGIRIYTTPLSGSDFEAFKAVAELDVSVSRLMAVMIDPESCTEWVHNCVISKAFGDGDFHDRYAYSVNDMPWPVQDRDYVIRIQTQGNKASGVIVMALNAIPNARDEKDDYVRVDKSDTLYRFEPLNADQTRLTWIQHTEPNGAIPSWLVNSLVVDIPLKSIRNLESIAQKPRYADYNLVFNPSGALVDVVKSEGDVE
ncbi:START domain-containing protein [Marinobacter fonticola]|uniref:START domain-containing protein n=1 Tax=Marinobacter fonticola TaxID=2603215 RepID=UPI001D0DAD36|nr:START domain-containing protein [Marinobacter fonticola]